LLLLFSKKKKESGSFLKKRTKKLFSVRACLAAGAVMGGHAQEC
jgi:hypothetical protein